MPDSPPNLDEDICVHIFSVSATLIGVCLTVIGIIRVVLTLRREDLIADDLVALNTMFYLGAALCAYWSLRTHRTQRGWKMMRLADVLFLVALVFSAFNAAFITWMIGVA